MSFVNGGGSQVRLEEAFRILFYIKISEVKNVSVVSTTSKTVYLESNYMLSLRIQIYD